MRDVADCNDEVDEADEKKENTLLKIDPPLLETDAEFLSSGIGPGFEPGMLLLASCGPSSNKLGCAEMILNRIVFSILARGNT